MATETRSEATAADLAAVPENEKAEIVNGEIVLMSPTGGYPGRASLQVVLSLEVYAKRTKQGHAIPDNVGFLVDLPNRKSFSPDAAYYLGPMSMGFLEGAPVFAVEVRSESDYGPAAERDLARKRADYFAAGTLVVWDVDLLSEDVIRSYHFDAPDDPIVFAKGTIAHAEPAVPGWSMSVEVVLE